MNPHHCFHPIISPRLSLTLSPSDTQVGVQLIEPSRPVSRLALSWTLGFSAFSALRSHSWHSSGPASHGVALGEPPQAILRPGGGQETVLAAHLGCQGGCFQMLTLEATQWRGL